MKLRGIAIRNTTKQPGNTGRAFITAPVVSRKTEAWFADSTRLFHEAFGVTITGKRDGSLLVMRVNRTGRGSGSDGS